MALAHLKQLPCPAGDECTAFKCLFSHNKDKTSPDSLVADAAGPTDDSVADASDLSTPRKRQRIENDSPKDSPSRSSKNVGRVGSGRGEEAKPGAQLTSHLASVTRTVSPPPLKRKLYSEPADTLMDRKGLPDGKGGLLPMPRYHYPPPLPAAAPLARKPESLNPRHLKSSPASHAVRLKLLKLLHHEYTRLNQELKKDASKEEESLLLSDQELIFRALDEEQKIATEKPAIYSNIVKNRIMHYKRMTVRQWVDERRAETTAKAQSTSKQPGGKSPKPPVEDVKTGLTPSQDVQLLRRLLTPIDDLAGYGYVPSVPKPEDVAKARTGQEMSQGWERCDRCQERFQVFPGRREEDGALASGGSCTHHWGKTYFPARTLGDPGGKPPKRYKCCGQAVGDSAGCTTTPCHVFKVSAANRLASTLNFAETPANPHALPDRAVCFDCEMCYTVQGMELVRLTATAWPGQDLLMDVLVRPQGEILDLNSRFSGIWPDDFAGAAPWSPADPLSPPANPDRKAYQAQLRKVASPAAARDLLFGLLTPETPLIGHGLENDLNAARIVHPTLVDTVLLYPHPRGLPLRRGLKMLMDSELGRQIQVEADDGTVQGHDSAEDARAAGELVLLRCKREWGVMQIAGWKVEGDEFVPPPAGAGPAEGVLTEVKLEAGY